VIHKGNLTGHERDSGGASSNQGPGDWVRADGWDVLPEGSCAGLLGVLVARGLGRSGS